MIDRAAVEAWLKRYVEAWKSYDRHAIAELFSDDTQYFYNPYSEGVKGRAAVVEAWFNNQDAPGTYDATYHPVAIDGDLVVTNGRSRYFEADGKTLRTEYDNIFLIRFNDAGECTEFREWWMEKPKPRKDT